MKSIKSILGLILILLVFSDCASVNIKYDKRNIEKKYLAKEYQITLEGQAIDFENLYLNKDNIKAIIRNRKEKSISIEQKIKPTFIGLKDFESDTLKLENIALVIIEGIPIENENWVEIVFEENSVQDFEVLKRETLSKLNFFCSSRSGDILLITIK